MSEGTGSSTEGGDTPSAGDEGPTLPLTIRLARQRGLGRLDEAPVSAGYAVRVVRGTTAREVTVEPGMYADGWGELLGTTVSAGERVQVPR